VLQLKRFYKNILINQPPNLYAKGAQNNKTMASFSKIYKELKEAVDRWSIADTWKTGEEKEALKAYKYCQTQMKDAPVTVYGAAKELSNRGISIENAAKLYEHVALCEILSLLSVSRHVGIVGSNSTISEFTGVFQGESYENSWSIWAGNIHPLYVGTFEDVESFLKRTIELQEIFE
jgi:hypothetical protein